MRRAIAVTVVVMTSLACGGGTGIPTGPSTTGAVAGGSAPGTSVLVVFTPLDTYTARINGRTFTAAGGFALPLAPFTYEITGTFRGAGFGVGFASIRGGGAESGSIRSLAGPSPEVRSCSVTYFNFDTPATTREFRVQFRVTSNVGSACQGA